MPFKKALKVVCGASLLLLFLSSSFLFAQSSDHSNSSQQNQTNQVQSLDSDTPGQPTVESPTMFILPPRKEVVTEEELVAAVVCGNQVIEAGEQCDDGNLINEDGCSIICKAELCGNRILSLGEECDDGNFIDGDGCSHLCLSESVCGNGNKEIGESCDDGNLINADGCSSDCQKESCATDSDCRTNRSICLGSEKCIGGVCQTGDPIDCDDRNLCTNDGCIPVNGQCSNLPKICPPNHQCDSNTGQCESLCGNGRIDGTEECDDQNRVSGDGCSVTCERETICGDDIVEGNEQCDGNSNPCDRGEICIGCACECPGIPDFTIGPDGKLVRVSGSGEQERETWQENVKSSIGLPIAWAAQDEIACTGPAGETGPFDSFRVDIDAFCANKSEGSFSVSVTCRAGGCEKTQQASIRCPPPSCDTNNDGTCEADVCQQFGEGLLCDKTCHCIKAPKCTDPNRPNDLDACSTIFCPPGLICNENNCLCVNPPPCEANDACVDNICQNLVGFRQPLDCTEDKPCQCLPPSCQGTGALCDPSKCSQFEGSVCDQACRCVKAPKCTDPNRPNDQDACSTIFCPPGLVCNNDCLCQNPVPCEENGTCSDNICRNLTGFREPLDCTDAEPCQCLPVSCKGVGNICDPSKCSQVEGSVCDQFCRCVKAPKCTDPNRPNDLDACSTIFCPPGLVCNNDCLCQNPVPCEANNACVDNICQNLTGFREPLDCTEDKPCQCLPPSCKGAGDICDPSRCNQFEGTVCDQACRCVKAPKCTDPNRPNDQDACSTIFCPPGLVCNNACLCQNPVPCEQNDACVDNICQNLTGFREPLDCTEDKPCQCLPPSCQGTGALCDPSKCSQFEGSVCDQACRCVKAPKCTDPNRPNDLDACSTIFCPPGLVCNNSCLCQNPVPCEQNDACVDNICQNLTGFREPLDCTEDKPCQCLPPSCKGTGDICDPSKCEQFEGTVCDQACRCVKAPKCTDPNRPNDLDACSTIFCPPGLVCNNDCLCQNPVPCEQNDACVDNICQNLTGFREPLDCTEDKPCQCLPPSCKGTGDICDPSKCEQFEGTVCDQACRCVKAPKCTDPNRPNDLDACSTIFCPPGLICNENNCLCINPPPCELNGTCTDNICANLGFRQPLDCTEDKPCQCLPPSCKGAGDICDPSKCEQFQGTVCDRSCRCVTAPKCTDPNRPNDRDACSTIFCPPNQPLVCDPKDCNCKNPPPCNDRIDPNQCSPKECPFDRRQLECTAEKPCQCLPPSCDLNNDKICEPDACKQFNGLVCDQTCRCVEAPKCTDPNRPNDLDACSTIFCPPGLVCNNSCLCQNPVPCEQNDACVDNICKNLVGFREPLDCTEDKPCQCLPPSCKGTGDICDPSKCEQFEGTVCDQACRCVKAPKCTDPNRPNDLDACSTIFCPPGLVCNNDCLCQNPVPCEVNDACVDNICQNLTGFREPLDCTEDKPCQCLPPSCKGAGDICDPTKCEQFEGTVCDQACRCVKAPKCTDPFRPNDANLCSTIFCPQDTNLICDLKTCLCQNPPPCSKDAAGQCTNNCEDPNLVCNAQCLCVPPPCNQNLDGTCADKCDNPNLTCDAKCQCILAPPCKNEQDLCVNTLCLPELPVCNQNKCRCEVGPPCNDAQGQCLDALCPDEFPACNQETCRCEGGFCAGLPCRTIFENGKLKVICPKPEPAGEDERESWMEQGDSDKTGPVAKEPTGISSETFRMKQGIAIPAGNKYSPTHRIFVSGESWLLRKVSSSTRFPLGATRLVRNIDWPVGDAEVFSAKLRSGSVLLYGGETGSLRRSARIMRGILMKRLRIKDPLRTTFRPNPRGTPGGGARAEQPQRQALPDNQTVFQKLLAMTSHWFGEGIAFAQQPEPSQCQVEIEIGDEKETVVGLSDGLDLGDIKAEYCPDHTGERGTITLSCQGASCVGTEVFSCEGPCSNDPNTGQCGGSCPNSGEACAQQIGGACECQPKENCALNGTCAPGQCPGEQKCDVSSSQCLCVNPCSRGANGLCIAGECADRSKICDPNLCECVPGCGIGPDGQCGGACPDSGGTCLQQADGGCGCGTAPKCGSNSQCTGQCPDPLACSSSNPDCPCVNPCSKDPQTNQCVVGQCNDQSKTCDPELCQCLDSCGPSNGDFCTGICATAGTVCDQRDCLCKTVPCTPDANGVQCESCPEASGLSCGGPEERCLCLNSCGPLNSAGICTGNCPTVGTVCDQRDCLCKPPPSCTPDENGVQCKTCPLGSSLSCGGPDVGCLCLNSCGPKDSAGQCTGNCPTVGTVCDERDCLCKPAPPCTEDTSGEQCKSCPEGSRLSCAGPGGGCQCLNSCGPKDGNICTGSCPTAGTVCDQSTCLCIPTPSCGPLDEEGFCTNDCPENSGLVCNAGGCQCLNSCGPKNSVGICTGNCPTAGTVCDQSTCLCIPTPSCGPPDEDGFCESECPEDSGLVCSSGACQCLNSCGTVPGQCNGRCPVIGTVCDQRDCLCRPAPPCVENPNSPQCQGCPEGSQLSCAGPGGGCQCLNSCGPKSGDICTGNCPTGGTVCDQSTCLCIPTPSCGPLDEQNQCTTACPEDSGLVCSSGACQCLNSCGTVPGQCNGRCPTIGTVCDQRDCLCRPAPPCVENPNSPQCQGCPEGSQLSCAGPGGGCQCLNSCGPKSGDICTGNCPTGGTVCDQSTCLCIPTPSCGPLDEQNQCTTACPEDSGLVCSSGACQCLNSCGTVPGQCNGRCPTIGTVCDQRDCLCRPAPPCVENPNSPQCQGCPEGSQLSCAGPGGGCQCLNSCGPKSGDICTGNCPTGGTVCDQSTCLCIPTPSCGPLDEQNQCTTACPQDSGLVCSSGACQCLNSCGTVPNQCNGRCPTIGTVCDQRDCLCRPAPPCVENPNSPQCQGCPEGSQLSCAGPGGGCQCLNSCGPKSGDICTGNCPTGGTVCDQSTCLCIPTPSCGPLDEQNQCTTACPEDSGLVCSSGACQCLNSCGTVPGQCNGRCPTIGTVCDQLDCLCKPAPPCIVGANGVQCQSCPEGSQLSCAGPGGGCLCLNSCGPLDSAGICTGNCPTAGTVCEQSSCLCIPTPSCGPLVDGVCTTDCPTDSGLRCSEGACQCLNSCGTVPQQCNGRCPVAGTVCDQRDCLCRPAPPCVENPNSPQCQGCPEGSQLSCAGPGGGCLCLNSCGPKDENICTGNCPTSGTVCDQSNCLCIPAPPCTAGANGVQCISCPAGSGLSCAGPGGGCICLNTCGNTPGQCNGPCPTVGTICNPQTCLCEDGGGFCPGNPPCNVQLVNGQPVVVCNPNPAGEMERESWLEKIPSWFGEKVALAQEAECLNPQIEIKIGDRVLTGDEALDPCKNNPGKAVTTSLICEGTEECFVGNVLNCPPKCPVEGSLGEEETCGGVCDNASDACVPDGSGSCKCEPATCPLPESKPDENSQCSFTCPFGSVCAAASAEECKCVPGCPVGNAAPLGGSCGGQCENADEICTTIGGVCECKPQCPDGGPAVGGVCGGVCPDQDGKSQTCNTRPDGTNCECGPPPCAIGADGQCKPGCPEGQVCAANAEKSKCDCVAGCHKDPTDGTCGGQCENAGEICTTIGNNCECQPKCETVAPTEGGVCGGACEDAGEICVTRDGKCQCEKKCPAECVVPEHCEPFTIRKKAVPDVGCPEPAHPDRTVCCFSGCLKPFTCRPQNECQQFDVRKDGAGSGCPGDQKCCIPKPEFCPAQPKCKVEKDGAGNFKVVCRPPAGEEEKEIWMEQGDSDKTGPVAKEPTGISSETFRIKQGIVTTTGIDYSPKLRIFVDEESWLLRKFSSSTRFPLGATRLVLDADWPVGDAEVLEMGGSTPGGGAHTEQPPRQALPANQNGGSKLVGLWRAMTANFFGENVAWAQNEQDNCEAVVTGVQSGNTKTYAPLPSVPAACKDFPRDSQLNVVIQCPNEDGCFPGIPPSTENCPCYLKNGGTCGGTCPNGKACKPQAGGGCNCQDIPPGGQCPAGKCVPACKAGEVCINPGNGGPCNCFPPGAQCPATGCQPPCPAGQQCKITKKGTGAKCKCEPIPPGGPCLPPLGCNPACQAGQQCVNAGGGQCACVPIGGPCVAPLGCNPACPGGQQCINAGPLCICNPVGAQCPLNGGQCNPLFRCPPGFQCKVINGQCLCEKIILTCPLGKCISDLMCVPRPPAAFDPLLPCPQLAGVLGQPPPPAIVCCNPVQVMCLGQSLCMFKGQCIDASGAQVCLQPEILANQGQTCDPNNLQGGFKDCCCPLCDPKKCIPAAQCDVNKGDKVVLGVVCLNGGVCCDKPKCVTPRGGCIDGNPKAKCRNTDTAAKKAKAQRDCESCNKGKCEPRMPDCCCCVPKPPRNPQPGAPGPAGAPAGAPAPGRRPQQDQPARIPNLPPNPVIRIPVDLGEPGGAGAGGEQGMNCPCEMLAEEVGRFGCRACRTGYERGREQNMLDVCVPKGLDRDQIRADHAQKQQDYLAKFEELRSLRRDLNHVNREGDDPRINGVGIPVDLASAVGQAAVAALGGDALRVDINDPAKRRFSNDQAQAARQRAAIVAALTPAIERAERELAQLQKEADELAKQLQMANNLQNGARIGNGECVGMGLNVTSRTIKQSAVCGEPIRYFKCKEPLPTRTIRECINKDGEIINKARDCRTVQPDPPGRRCNRDECRNPRPCNNREACRDQGGGCGCVDIPNPIGLRLADNGTWYLDEGGSCNCTVTPFTEGWKWDPDPPPDPPGVAVPPGFQGGEVPGGGGGGQAAGCNDRVGMCGVGPGCSDDRCDNCVMCSGRTAGRCGGCVKRMIHPRYNECGQKADNTWIQEGEKCFGHLGNSVCTRVRCAFDRHGNAIIDPRTGLITTCCCLKCLLPPPPPPPPPQRFSCPAGMDLGFQGQLVTLGTCKAVQGFAYPGDVRCRDLDPDLNRTMCYCCHLNACRRPGAPW